MKYYSGIELNEDDTETAEETGYGGRFRYRGRRKPEDFAAEGEETDHEDH